MRVLKGADSNRLSQAGANSLGFKILGAKAPIAPVLNRPLNQGRQKCLPTISQIVLKIDAKVSNKRNPFTAICMVGEGSLPFPLPFDPSNV